MNETITVNISLKGFYVLELPGLGTSGYSWVYEVGKKDQVVAISHQYIVPPNPAPGQRGIERFTITGVQRGSCVIDFKQVQSWAKDQPPLDTRRVEVNVG
jgi:hypothetical protein